MSPQAVKDFNPQPGQYWKPGLRYRESMGGAIAAIHDLVVANGGVPKYYQSNWGGLIAAIRDLQLGGGGTFVHVGATPQGFTPGTPGTPGTPAGPGNVPPAVAPTPATPGSWVTQPQNGDLWFDERQGRLMVWVNGAYYQTNGAENTIHVGTAAPLDVSGNPVKQQGLLWYDPTKKSTFIYVDNPGGTGGRWKALNSEKNKAYVAPEWLNTYYPTPPFTYTENATKTGGVLVDNTSALNVNVGDLIAGLSGNGGGVVTAITGNSITIGPDIYNGPLVPGESLRIGNKNTVGTGVSQAPKSLTGLTYTYVVATKELQFGGQVPSSIFAGSTVTNTAGTGGGTVELIRDSDADGIPDTVRLASSNYVGDLTDNDDLQIEAYHPTPAVIGDTWYRNDTATLAFWDGNQWIEINTGSNTTPQGWKHIITDGDPLPANTKTVVAVDTTGTAFHAMLRAQSATGARYVEVICARESLANNNVGLTFAYDMPIGTSPPVLDIHSNVNAANELELTVESPLPVTNLFGTIQYI